MIHPRWWVAGLACVAMPLAAQQWDTPAARSLAERGVAARGAVAAPWRARAEGLVLFLAQVGDLAAPPRVVRADQLDVEVYGHAPGGSKQVILGWRGRNWLPTDIDYHRDHLGIVTDGFGDLIRVGEGDEVRGVPHPLSPAGLGRYAFALTDSVTIRSGADTLVLERLDVRPRDPARPGVVGSFYLDRASGALVRARFTFTAASYLDPDLEGISVVLENAEVAGRAWLPFRQEIEIRRRTRWLDFPARGIIRGRWEIGEYDLAPAAGSVPAFGPAIGGLLAPGDSVRPWGAPLDSVVARAARPAADGEFAAARRALEGALPAAALARVRAARLHAPRLSDLLRFDRVEGVALGAGVAFTAGPVELTPAAGVGLATGRMTGGAVLRWRAGPVALSAEATRRVRDFSDLPVISGALNSLTAEEGGADHGDYLLLDRVGIGLDAAAGARWRLGFELAREVPHTLAIAVAPASGTFRPNPAFGGPAENVARLGWTRTAGTDAAGSDIGGALRLEAGWGSARYGRATLALAARTATGASALRLRLLAGAGTDSLPAWRGFAIGGRGTLAGEPYRGWGGREMALASLEWRVPVAVPALRLGSFATTGSGMTLAPYVAAGWAGGAQAGMPWVPSPGVRPVAGVAAEWLMGLVRVETGWSLRTGSFGVTLDVAPDWWDVL
jgi:hypothetical protein